MITKMDYVIAGFVGFLVGVFAIPTAVNLGFREPFLLMALPLVVPFVWGFGVWLGKFLSRWIPFMGQFAKFAAVGFLNTAIDFGILNLLSVITGVTKGFVIGPVNIPGFIAALFNSYLWNKLWVFRGRDQAPLFSDFIKFVAVSVVGLFINTGIVIFATTYPQQFFNGAFSDTAILNVAKVAATILTLAWNFLGYKFFVFVRR